MLQCSGVALCKFSHPRIRDLSKAESGKPGGARDGMSRRAPRSGQPRADDRRVDPILWAPAHRHHGNGTSPSRSMWSTGNACTGWEWQLAVAHARQVMVH
jgi:hypothetical protein